MKFDLESLRRSRLARDLLGVALVVLAVCSLLALISYRGTAPSFEATKAPTRAAKSSTV